MSAVFITGTGTDIGKTFVATGLIRRLRELGRPVNALKPVVSGFDPRAPLCSDPAVLLKALGRDLHPESFDAISPWRFHAALSPDMAAQAEGRAINFEEVAEFCRAAIDRNTGTLLIEGIGGIMVPLDQRHTVLDLMLALRLPVILVAGSYLGTLSHLLCAQDVVLTHGLDLRAIVISETENASVPFDATLATLANFTNARLLGLRRQVAAATNDAVFRQLAQLIG
ncbi:MAG TPA: dethiobiotin synthase [Methylocella sp.]|nr:dethiobiotin synthase [Methylocella sp.]